MVVYSKAPWCRALCCIYFGTILAQCPPLPKARQKTLSALPPSRQPAIIKRPSPRLPQKKVLNSHPRPRSPAPESAHPQRQETAEAQVSPLSPSHAPNPPAAGPAGATKLFLPPPSGHADSLRSGWCHATAESPGVCVMQRAWRPAGRLRHLVAQPARRLRNLAARPASGAHGEPNAPLHGTLQRRST